ncbi:uncharacterized protein TNIN_449731 [Trichonephila inaurata madagascariensis]|uniref:Uncharacterized protein n=1 Tax=Trichonephila inaurata madagascariensis TaxID=2747483 RepID=A0A8X6JRD7_9ARAC|nr:uncharacterized protein TNIN_449731 [Trichonephila inaurata madagascariensis]
MWKDEVRVSVGCLMLVIIAEIGEIQKLGVYQIMAEMIIGVTMRMAVKENNDSKAGIDFRTMTGDSTIGDTNLEKEIEIMILLEGTAEIGVRIFRSVLVQGTATDFAQLKAELSKAFPAIRKSKDLETRFYASQPGKNQEPTDFASDLSKLHQKLEQWMSQADMIDHILVRLEPQDRGFNERGYQLGREIQMMILIEATAEIGVRVRISVDAIGCKGDD